MKILLDECVPWPMHRILVGHDSTTAQKRGWGGIKNGDLHAARRRSPPASRVALDQDQGPPATHK